MARAQVQSVYGSYLSPAVGEVDPTTRYAITSGNVVAVHFRIFQNAPFIDYTTEDIRIPLSRPAFETWTGTDVANVELWKGTGAPATRLAFFQMTSFDPGYAGHVNFNWPLKGVTLDRNTDYWLIIQFFSTSGHTLLWHANRAGVVGTVGVSSASGWAFSNSVQPAVKIRGTPVGSPCPMSSMLTAAPFGTTTGPNSVELHTELLCPPATLQYYCAPIISIPQGTTSAAACDLMVTAINNPPVCFGPNTFSAERSGNIVRVSSTDCACPGAYVCADAAGIISFAKTMGYQSEGVPMKLNLFFDGVATGLAADPTIPAGTQVVHEVHDVIDGPMTVYATLHNAAPGATADDVAAGIARDLRLQGDFAVRAVGHRVQFDAPPSERIIAVDQQSTVETGAIPIQAMSPAGQSFTPTVEFLNYIDLRTYDAGGSNGATLRVKVRSGSIAGPVLGTSDAVDLPDGWASPKPVRFYFPAGVFAAPGASVFFEVEVMAGDPWLVATGPGAYPGGTAIALGVPDPSSDLWFTEGLLEREAGYYDLGYRINDSGLSWAIAPFDTPDPFDLFAPCPADLTRDGIIDFPDYLDFIDAYDTLNPRADFTADGIVDLADYLEFLNHYDAGC
ncbi:MAG: hypothetical protein IT436_07725 [Phycisphaerales bacterium]|nr:hypothetical protein [Phycisphaerales bacterium]